MELRSRIELESSFILSELEPGLSSFTSNGARLSWLELSSNFCRVVKIALKLDLVYMLHEAYKDFWSKKKLKGKILGRTKTNILIRAWLGRDGLYMTHSGLVFSFQRWPLSHLLAAIPLYFSLSVAMNLQHATLLLHVLMHTHITLVLHVFLHVLPITISPLIYSFDNCLYIYIVESPWSRL